MKTHELFCAKSWSQSKNLMDFNDNQVLVWQTCDQCVYWFRLKDETNITTIKNIANIQCLTLTNAPLFDVESVHLNGTGRYLALCGPKGVNILELPAKWGLNGAFDSTKASVLCRSWPLGQRFFVCNQDIELLCSGWHPNCPQQQHIALLTNDNCLRIFDIMDEEIPHQIINLSVGNPNQSVTQHIGVSQFAMSLGENAISFDFGASISKCYDVESSTVTSVEECLIPVYVLRGNGDVLLVYSSLKYSYVSNNVFGPLTMRPPAEDNYGVDACSIVCLDCVPPVLVIATSFGILYHCIALDCEEETDPDRSLLPQPTLYVYETIELSLSLTTSSDVGDTTCTIRLHKDRIPLRYFCSHACGLHAVAVPFVSQLKSKEESNFKEEESIVEHLICTQPIATTDAEQSAVPLGVAVSVQNGYTFVSVLLSSGELISRRLTPCYITHVFEEENDGSESESLSDVLPPKLDFVEYIKQLLKRNTSLPLLKSKNEPSDCEWPQKLQLLMTTTDLLETQYIKKFELTANAIDKRVKVLTNDKQIQLKELNKCLAEKDALLKALLALVDKYDETRERQEGLYGRIDKVLESLQFQRPQLSEAELKLKDELNRLSIKLAAHKNKLEQIKVKSIYQSQHKQIEPNTSDDRSTDGDRTKVQSTILSPNQIKSIKQMLAKQSEQIEQLVQSLHSLNTTNGF